MHRNVTAISTRVWRFVVLLASLPLAATVAQSATGTGVLDWDALYDLLRALQ